MTPSVRLPALLTLSLFVQAATRVRYADDLPYDLLLWPGTHNTAINLGDATFLRPSASQRGVHPSEAFLDYQYIVMDQRLSVRDQLDQGVRVRDFELGSLQGTKWECEPPRGGDRLNDAAGKCSEHVSWSRRCLSDCASTHTRTHDITHAQQLAR